MFFRCRAGELAEHLKKNLNALGIAAEQLDWETGRVTVTPGGHKITERGLHFASLRYDSSFYFERLPRAQVATLALLIQAWLEEHDDTRGDYDLPDVAMETISLDAGRTVDVDVTIEFVDPLELVADPEGPIVISDQRYSAGTYDIMVAETLGAVDGEAADLDHQ